MAIPLNPSFCLTEMVDRTLIFNSACWKILRRTIVRPESEWFQSMKPEVETHLVINSLSRLR